MTLISNSLPSSWNTAVRVFAGPASCLRGSSCAADPSPGEHGRARAVTPCCILPLSSSFTMAASLCPSVSNYIYLPLLTDSAFACLDSSLDGKKRQNGVQRSRPSSMYPAGRLRKFPLSTQTAAPSSFSGPERLRRPGPGKPTSPFSLGLPPPQPQLPLAPRPLPVGRLTQEARPRAPQHPRAPSPVPAPLRSQLRRTRRRLRRQRNKASSVCGGGGQLLPPARSRPSSMAAAPRGQRAAAAAPR